MATDQAITKAIKRFWSYVERSQDGCWNWRGNVDKAHGYGVANFCAERWKAHRLAFLLVNGDAPRLVMHSCDNRRCVNPSHLSAATHFENNMDCLAKGRNPIAEKTHCKRGHEYTPENTRFRPRKRADGSIAQYRECVKCVRFFNKMYMRKATGWPREPNYKLNEEQVRQARMEFASGYVTRRQIAERYGMNVASITLMLERKTWRNVE